MIEEIFKCILSWRMASRMSFQVRLAGRWLRKMHQICHFPQPAQLSPISHFLKRELLQIRACGGGIYSIPSHGIVSQFGIVVIVTDFVHVYRMFSVREGYSTFFGSYFIG